MRCHTFILYLTLITTTELRSDCSTLQVEIKLRLPNKEAHDKVAEALKDSYIETHDQENFFYEGSEKELNKARVSLRTRFYGGDKKCVITMKVCMQAQHLWQLLHCAA